MWDILVVSVIYIPLKSATFICVNATLSEAPVEICMEQSGL